MKELHDVSRPSYTAFMLKEKDTKLIYQLDESDRFCYTKEILAAGFNVFHTTRVGKTLIP